MVTKRAGAPAGLAEAKKRITPKKTNEGPSSGAPTSAKAWKKAATEGILIRVPSGNTCRMKTPGMEVFIKEGIIPNALLPVVQSMMAKGGEATDEEVSELMGDPEVLNKIFQLADAVTVYCCLDPEVHEVPADPAERDDDLLYVDEVDFTDKMFIFSVATGGTQNLERFREQSGLDVGIVSNG